MRAACIFRSSAVLTVFAAALSLSDASAQSCPVAPASSAEDCNLNGVKDSCDTGALTFVLFDGSIFGVPANDCKVNGVPDDCERSCYGGTSSVDADGDGISNCQEEWDGTDPCDQGSRIPRLNPVACASPNGFFEQVNIATVINTSFANMSVSVTYYDSTGSAQGSVDRELVPNQKWDVIVNDLGLKPDTYGTVCVNTHSQLAGLWTGGLTIYKLRDPSQPFGAGTNFDFALYYPFANPFTGVQVAPINTNFPLNPAATGTVANWVRLIDAAPGDGSALRGTLRFYNSDGAVLSTTAVDIPDGGRFDYDGHSVLGRNAVGLAEFTPVDSRTAYYLEATRYFYEGTGATSTHFYTAFPLPIQPLSGAARSAPIAATSGEFSVVELLNGSGAAVTGNGAAALGVFSNAGVSSAASGKFDVAAKGTVHRIVAGVPETAGDNSWARVSGPVQSLNETALVYGFDRQGGLLYGYATPLVESPGPRQTSEFNTFIGHENTLKLINSSPQPMKIDFQIFDYNHSPIALPAELQGMTLAPQEYRSVVLSTLPRDSYGTIVAHVQDGKVGLVMLNQVVRPGLYVMPFMGR